MIRLRLAALAVSASLLASCSLPPKPSDAEKDASQPSAYARIQQIPPADPAKYNNTPSFKSWRNPYLIIRKDGVGLLDVADNEERLIKLDDLPQALAQLPASAWPYGRVVAVTESGVSGSTEDTVLIRKNRGIVLGTLESMHVLVSMGPSAG
jgi:hypothetical protein